MRIVLNAHLLSSQPGYRAAGIHTYIHQLLTHLAQVTSPDWDFTALVGAAVRAEYPGVALRHARWNTEPPLRRIVWEQVAQPWRVRGFDLLHSMAFVSPLVQPLPAVVTVYDLTFRRYPERLSTARRFYLRALTGLSCRRARRVLAISQSTADDLTNMLGIAPQKIDVTPLGYDEARFRPLPAEAIADFRRAKNLPQRFWLFLGTLEPRKNLPLLLEAYAALPAAARLPLVLAGGRGWETQAIDDAIARHSLGDAVRLPGFVPTDEMALWYNSAEAFLYPSVFEGFGLPVLEAMACGTPVLTSNVSSLPEIAARAGRCLPPHDAAAWRDALRQVAGDAEWRAEARARGLEEARHYRWEKTARQTLASYARALGSPVDGS